MEAKMTFVDHPDSVSDMVHCSFGDKSPAAAGRARLTFHAAALRPLAAHPTAAEVCSANARAIYDTHASPELRAMAERLTDVAPLYPIAAAAPAAVAAAQVSTRAFDVRASGDAALADFKRQFTADVKLAPAPNGARVGSAPAAALQRLHNAPIVWAAADDLALVASERHRAGKGDGCLECGEYDHAHVTITDAFPSHPDGGARRRERQRRLAWSLSAPEVAAPLRAYRLTDHGYPMSRL